MEITLKRSVDAARRLVVVDAVFCPPKVQNGGFPDLPGCRL